MEPDNKVWYEISATALAKKTTNPGEPDFNTALQRARGVKYGHPSYAKMYMLERAKVLGNWNEFLMHMCSIYNINLKGDLLVLGVNDGQEVGHLHASRIVGVDIALDAVSRGRELYPSIDFMVRDLTTASFGASAFDTVLALRTLHIFDPEQTEHILINVHLSLNKYGVCVVSIPGGFLDIYGNIVYGQKVKEGNVDVEKPKVDAEVLRELMVKVGFHNVVVYNREIELFIIGYK